MNFFFNLLLIKKGVRMYYAIGNKQETIGLETVDCGLWTVDWRQTGDRLNTNRSKAEGVMAGYQSMETVSPRRDISSIIGLSSSMLPDLTAHFPL
jgi:hypothetical protein